MTRWGIGPKWALACVGCVVPLVVAERLWRGRFEIAVLPGGALTAAGVLPRMWLPREWP